MKLLGKVKFFGMMICLTLLMRSGVVHAADGQTFKNPIIGGGADPWVVQAGDNYYHCSADGNKGIYIARSSTIEGLGQTQSQRVYYTPDNTSYSSEVWAPELHYIQGRWYIYFAADNGDNANHRMYVLRGGYNANDPLDGGYEFMGKISDRTDRWAIDGTVLQHSSGLYFIWSGWEGTSNVKQNLYIARMSNPWTISSDRVCISTPTESWERVGNPWVNEGPQVLVKGNSVHVIYSASGSWTNEYCLGRITCTDGNFVNPSSWKKAGPVFSQANGVYGPGHASFVKSKDGMQDYIVYHAAKYNGAGWDRNIRTQMFTWHGDTPYFGEPIGADVELAKPSNGNYAPVTNDRIYTVVNVANGKVLDIPNRENANGVQLQTYSENGTPAQEFRFVRDAEGYYTIIPVCAASRALDDPNATDRSGSIIQIYDQNGTDAQKWRAEYLGGGMYRLINKASLKALEDNGNRVIQNTLSNNQTQMWYLKEVFNSADTFLIQNLNSGKVLDIIGGNTSNGGVINQWEYDPNSLNQSFYLRQTASHTYNIVHRYSGKVASIENSSRDNFAQLHLWDINGDGGTDQQWTIYTCGDGLYKIKNVNSGRMLEVGNGEKGNNAKVNQYDDNGTPAQRWYFIKK